MIKVVCAFQQKKKIIFLNKLFIQNIKNILYLNIKIKYIKSNAKHLSFVIVAN